MAKISLQCNTLSQTHPCVFFRLKAVGSAEPSLAEIHQEMSELLDKQVNAQTEKSFQGSCKLPQAHKKVCDENETKKQIRKMTCAQKCYSWKEVLYNIQTKYQ